MYTIYGSAFDFVPLSYILPLDYAKFALEMGQRKADGKNDVWIMKVWKLMVPTSRCDVGVLSHESPFLRVYSQLTQRKEKELGFSETLKSWSMTAQVLSRYGVLRGLCYYTKKLFIHIRVSFSNSPIHSALSSTFQTHC